MSLPCRVFSTLDTAVQLRTTAPSQITTAPWRKGVATPACNFPSISISTSGKNKYRLLMGQLTMLAPATSRGILLMPNAYPLDSIIGINVSFCGIVEGDNTLGTHECFALDPIIVHALPPHFTNVSFLLLTHFRNRKHLNAVPLYSTAAYFSPSSSCMEASHRCAGEYQGQPLIQSSNPCRSRCSSSVAFL